jgi:hypothetical protein
MRTISRTFFVFCCTTDKSRFDENTLCGLKVY